MDVFVGPSQKKVNIVVDFSFVAKYSTQLFISAGNTFIMYSSYTTMT